MPGPVPKDPDARVNRRKPIRGEWQASAGVGWQHGDIPKPPTRLLQISRATWTTWMQSWFAAHWTADDLPGLGLVILLFDQVQRGDAVRMTELRQMMDNYGITPKGQQDRRWAPPKRDDAAIPNADEAEDMGPYRGLRVVAG